MKLKKYKIFLMVGILLFPALVSISAKSTTINLYQSNLKVAVSIAPFVEWVKEVGGDNVEVLSLIPEGQDPHTYAPTTNDLEFVSNADAWFQAGLIDFDREYEPAILSSAGFTASDIVNFSEFVDLVVSATNYQELPQTAQAVAYDPHFWLSPTRAITSVEKIVEKLSTLDPTHASEYVINGENYILELNSLNDSITSQLSGVENRHMLVFHPSWGYFCDDFNLTLIALEEEGKDPSSQHYAQVLEEVKSYQVGVIFVQEQISESMAQSFARDACVEVVQLNPLAGDYISNLNSTSYILAEKLNQAPVCNKIPGYMTSLVFIIASGTIAVISLMIFKKKEVK